MNLRYSVLFLGWMLVMLVACKQNKDTPPSPVQKEYSAKPISIKNLYLEDAVKILYDGSYLTGPDEILNHYTKNPMDVKDSRIFIDLIANEKKGLTYEMSEIIDANDLKYQQILIWKDTDTLRHQAFEHIAPKRKADVDLSEINASREQWMELCNAHNSKDLIHKMYSENTLYYNHKPMVVGREELVKEYDYMNRANYKLTLKPIIVEVVNEDCVFEIGQCEGSYNGKYIIVWRKDFSEKWEVFIDSNI
ncbi:MAG: hypothetical protein AAGA77_02635 [Bacteroidota bacterium]